MFVSISLSQSNINFDRTVHCWTIFNRQILISICIFGFELPVFRLLVSWFTCLFVCLLLATLLNFSVWVHWFGQLSKRLCNSICYFRFHFTWSLSLYVFSFIVVAVVVIRWWSLVLFHHSFAYI